MPAFGLSPSVNITEIDVTNIVPAIAIGLGGYVGDFAWGPAEEIVLVDTENYLKERFWGPNSRNYEDWFSAANFLSYARDLQLVRAINTSARNATIVTNTNGTELTGTGQLVKNRLDHSQATFTTNTFIAKYPGALGNALGIAWVNADGFDDLDSNGDSTWDFYDFFNGPPGENEIHLVVYDETGGITGTSGTILERFEFVSLTAGVKRHDGRSAYIADVLNNESAWVWAGNLASFLTTPGTNNGVTFGGGTDGTAPTDGNRQAAWALFQNDEEIDLSYAIQGASSRLTGKWIIDNVAEVRKDCVAFVSPQKADVVGILDVNTIRNNVATTRTLYGSTSYGFMDSQWKYQYDRYNDTYRWIPMSADIAGLSARTAFTHDAWWSPAGYNRGNIKGVTKLTYSQGKTVRDFLYKNSVNPVAIFKNQGPVLFGDKTLLTRPSAFDRINVRFLFIVLEKSIATAAKFMLFEFNDEFTRNLFVNMVTPFLRDIKGRRGLRAFKVICDETNNTDQVISSNQFVGDIAVLPNYSINWINLNFIAARDNGTVEFSEF